MFAIGSSLREAREKRGLELDAVQRTLRIRRRYLEALEADRFELLPGEVYARGFLREYAEFLGLDGWLYVEEYNARFAQREEHAIAAQPSVRRRRAPTTRLVVVGALAAAALAGAVAAWRLASGPGGTASAPPARAAQTAATTHARRRATPPAAPGRATNAVLTLTAARGDCWVGVRLGSSAGRTLYWQTLHQGEKIRFGLRQPLWVRVGDGHNLDVTVGGKPLTGVPQVTGELVVRA